MSHHIVHVKNLQHVYPDQTVALQDVSFLIHHGESEKKHLAKQRFDQGKRAAGS